VKQTLTILHLSDLHIVSGQSGGAVLQNQVFEKFWNYVDSWEQDPIEKNPDIIIVTGDLATTGKTQEFGAIETGDSTPVRTVSQFLGKLCDTFALPRSRVFMTPGNHDVDRGLINKAYAETDFKFIHDELSLADFFFDPNLAGNRNEILRRLRPYYEFYCNFIGGAPSNRIEHLIETVYSSRCAGPPDGMPIRVMVASLCTCWLSQSYYLAYPSDPKVKSAGEEPPGWIALCQPMVEKCIKSIDPADANIIRIAIMHHPSSWLVDWERQFIDRLLGCSFDLILTGHIHKEDIYIPQLGQRGHRISAGSFFLSKQYRNSFNIIKIETDNGRPRWCYLRVVEWNNDYSLWANPTVHLQIDDRYKALGYGYVNGWLRIPLSGNCPVLLEAKIEVKIHLPGRRKDNLDASEMEQITALIRLVGKDLNVEYKSMEEHSTVITYEIPVSQAHNLCDALSSPDQPWYQLCLRCGIGEIQVGKRRFVIKHHSKYLPSQKIDDREVRIHQADIAGGFDGGYGILWRELGYALNEMFIVRCIDDLLLPGRKPEDKGPDEIYQEDLTPSLRDMKNQDNPAVDDWEWYCPNRISPEKQVECITPETLMYKFLKEAVVHGTKKVILVYGGTGHGKTTFLRYFFKSYLGSVDPELAAKTIAVRISLGIAGMTIESLEDDVDNKVNIHLNNRFPELYDDEHMIRMAELVTNLKTDFHARLLATHPMGDTPEDKLRWINMTVGRPSVIPECNNVFADFNRIRIQYLNQKMGKKFILVLDNIDQMPRRVQEAAFMLARHKLEWVQDTNDVTIIIAFRAYMLARAAKELPLAGYQNRYEVPIRPCRIGDILERRMKYAENKLPAEFTFEEKNLFRPAGASVTVAKSSIKRMLLKWIEVFGDLQTDLALSKMSNNDMREQLRMVQAVLKSPHFDWVHFLDTVAQARSQHISHDKLLDLLLRGTNILCSVDSPVFFINLFNAGNYQHFANSLNQMYILLVLKQLRYEYVDNIVSMLAELGHPPLWTKGSFETMLLRNIIFSTEGQYLYKDKVRRVYFDLDEAPLAHFYIETLPYRLYYLQAMAYQTPMLKEWRDEVPLPNKFGEEISEFTTRVRAAIALIKQIADDEKCQFEVIKGDRNKVDMWKQFGLCGIAERMCSEAKEQLQTIKNLGLYSGLNWSELLGLIDRFKIVAD
jgi:hypothetical protein